ncbi:DUF3592 domain-containing protein [Streptomyces sp. NPDC059564]|uniref:DUF3592 domain-containing protein n=1 Tax=Streptomyces sp. NPDC059564 TaxID=3346865 RepID=UPI003686B0C8
MFSILFAAIPSLMALAALAGIARVVVLGRRLRAAWSSGIAVPGRLLRTRVTTVTRSAGYGRAPSTTSSRRQLYEFTTLDGEVTRFEEAGSSLVLEGEPVTVRYPRGRPDRATALPPGDRGARTKSVLAIGCLTFLALLCVTVACVFFTVASGIGEIRHRVDRITRLDVPDAPPAAPPAPPGGPSLQWPTELPPPPSGFPDLPH